MPNEKILNRIQKLLNLANNAGATEGERNAAMHHASKLLQKYNLSIADLPPEQNTEKREEQTLTICGDRWLRDICASTARLFFCNYLYSSTGTSGKWNNHFIGRQSNVITAMHMSEYLIKSIKREATKRYRSPTTPEGRSFCVGATRTIVNRMRIMWLEAQEPAKPAPAAQPQSAVESEYLAIENEMDSEMDGVKTTALALASLYKSEEEANRAFMHEMWGDRVKEEKPRQGGFVKSNAYNAGREHGKSVSLNQQVGGTAPKRTLIGN